MIILNTRLNLAFNQRNIGLLLQLYRKRYDFKAAYVAKKIKLSNSYYSKLENGRAELRMSQLSAICMLYDITPVEFYLHFCFKQQEA